MVRGIRHIYWVLIPLAIGFMFLHHFLDFLRKLLRKERFISPADAAFRLNPHFRIAHWLTLISFPVLVVTGFALKFPESWWAQPLLVWESHFAFRGTIHRVAAVVLVVSLGYHVVHLILDHRAWLIIRHMTPQLKDFRDLRDVVRYDLGLNAARPLLSEFTYVEKLEYLAYMWGTIVMATTGFILWFNTLALRYFPKWVLDASTALHYYEAILATFSILIWHLYSVVFDPDVYPMDRVRLRHPQPDNLAQAVAERQPPTASPASPAAPTPSQPDESSAKSPAKAEDPRAPKKPQAE